MPKTTTPALPLDPALYHQTLASLHLLEVALDHLNVSCQNEMSGKVTFSISSEARHELADGTSTIYAEYNVIAGNEKHVLFGIDVTFRVALVVPDDSLPDGFIEVYIANNLNITVFPYVREIVSSMTARMGLPPLTLPYIVNPFAPAEPTPSTTTQKIPKRRAPQKAPRKKSDD